MAEVNKPLTEFPSDVRTDVPEKIEKELADRVNKVCNE